MSLSPNHLAHLFTKMISKTVKIINKLGLHTRAALKFVEVTSKYVSEVSVTCRNKKAKGRSIIELMLLEALENSEITIEVNGQDELDCMNELIDLVENYFGNRRNYMYKGILICPE